MDMVRFRKFTNGPFLVGEYGSHERGARASVLMRMEKRAGKAGINPTAKQIDEIADRWVLPA
jgi:prolyl oligopeptidase PreP (S9A serine peptidase family)